MSKFVAIHRRGESLEITFARPERKNALSLAMYDAAAEALETVEDQGVKTVILSGDGGHFSSGNDLMDFLKDPPTGEESPVFRFLQALRRCPIPVLAAVEGYAIGIGTTMLLHCDFAWATESAKFRLPFVPLGLVPEAGSSVMFPATLGHRKAAELLYLGDFFDAATAEAAGLLNGVTEEPLAEARAVAEKLAGLPSEALRQTKSLLRRTDDAVVEEAMKREAELFVERLQSSEFLEAVASFTKGASRG